LWWGFVRHLPLWIVVFAVTYSLYLVMGDFRPIVQLLICAPAELLAGAVMIYASSELRRTARGIVNIAVAIKA
jgi:uncharacterized membrane protein